MTFTDPIADMITRIRNAQLRSLSKVSIPNSKLRAKILDVLKSLRSPLSDEIKCFLRLFTRNSRLRKNDSRKSVEKRSVLSR